MHAPTFLEMLHFATWSALALFAPRAADGIAAWNAWPPRREPQQPAQVDETPREVEDTGMQSGDRSPTDIETELQDAQIRRPNLLRQVFGEGLDGPLVTWLARVEQRSDIDLGLAYTMLFQQASGGPGQRNAGGGDLDFFGRWIALGADSPNSGSLFASFEYRHDIGGTPPAELGPDIGTLLRTTSGFGNRPPTLKECFWEQGLLDGALLMSLGKIDPDDFSGGFRYQSANTGFLYQAFSGNPSIAFPGATLAVGARVKPADWMYATGVVCNANGDTEASAFSDLGDHEYFTMAELGFQTSIPDTGLGWGRLTAWHVDERASAGERSGQGFCATVDQDLGDRTTCFARYGHSSGGVAKVEDLLEAGLTRQGLLGVEGNLSGLAASWAEPPDSGLRDEKAVELFHRIQVTQRIQLTFDVELVLDPSKAPQTDAVAVFSVRLRFSY